jgi:DNA-binding NtrC family response regulator
VLGIGDSGSEAPLIGKSRIFQRVLERVERIAPVDCTVLISGETGSGKELVAKTVHVKSGRANGPFVIVNCPAIPVSLIESELFGHERGAYTGATDRTSGKFGCADKGTVVLDEVSEVPVSVQAKLLRVVENGEVDRLGSRSSIQVDVRFIATTSRDLREEVEGGRFRPDLFFRLKVAHIHLPPLRERGDDIMLLADFFLDYYNKQYCGKIRGFSRNALEMLRVYHWPGNVRELKHAVEGAVLFSRNGLILAEDLDIFGERPRLLPKRRTRSEINAVKTSLAENRGNVSKTAEELGLSRKGLYYIMRKHHIGPDGYRRGICAS